MTAKKLHLYVLKTCDTCRKAIKTLEAAGNAFSTTDVRADGIPSAVLDDLISRVGADLLINTRSTTWRGLAEAERAMAETAPRDLLLAHPTLMKRPVIVAGDTVHVGWGKDVQVAILD